MSGFSKGLQKVQVALKWDPAPRGAPPHDLDLIAAAYTADAPHGPPDYLVHFDRRSPDGTISLHRESRTGLGFGIDEALTLELDRLAPRYVRVVVGVAIQQSAADDRLGFARIANASVQVVSADTAVRISTGDAELAMHDLTTLGEATAATLAEFTRGEDGTWAYAALLRGYDADPADFTGFLGAA
ncbi:TerD family protein [Streptomyces sp. A7024]|uniref:TerD family protein n=1 Tax=Streptomyces coryli TaxID=1128680 RepID=A0A6G4U7V9_9ACTN|nr:TerD family protein [Streptomyces coryli]